jgi:hypothetical protein
MRAIKKLLLKHLQMILKTNKLTLIIRISNLMMTGKDGRMGNALLLEGSHGCLDQRLATASLKRKKMIGVEFQIAATTFKPMRFKAKWNDGRLKVATDTSQDSYT